jgi:ferredoxin
MGIGDLLKQAFENDPSLPPPSNPGLKKGPEMVTVEFLPKKKTVQAIRGQKLSDVARAAGVQIKYQCKKGECRTCEVNFNGKIVKTCQSFIPTSSNEKVYVVAVPEK